VLPAAGWYEKVGIKYAVTYAPYLHYCDAAVPPRLLQSLEDTPFYERSLLAAGLLGESVTAVHETLHVPRLVSVPVQAMLPFRMPRRT